MAHYRHNIKQISHRKRLLVAYCLHLRGSTQNGGNRKSEYDDSQLFFFVFFFLTQISDLRMLMVHIWNYKRYVLDSNDN